MANASGDATQITSRLDVAHFCSQLSEFAKMSDIAMVNPYDYGLLPSSPRLMDIRLTRVALMLPLLAITMRDVNFLRECLCSASVEAFISHVVDTDNPPLIHGFLEYIYDPDKLYLTQTVLDKGAGKWSISTLRSLQIWLRYGSSNAELHLNKDDEAFWFLWDVLNTYRAAQLAGTNVSMEAAARYANMDMNLIEALAKGNQMTRLRTLISKLDLSPAKLICCLENSPPRVACTVIGEWMNISPYSLCHCDRVRLLKLLALGKDAKCVQWAVERGWLASIGHHPHAIAVHNTSMSCMRVMVEEVLSKASKGCLAEWKPVCMKVCLMEGSTEDIQWAQRHGMDSNIDEDERMLLLADACTAGAIDYLSDKLKLWKDSDLLGEVPLPYLNGVLNAMENNHLECADVFLEYYPDTWIKASEFRCLSGNESHLVRSMEQATDRDCISKIISSALSADPILLGHLEIFQMMRPRSSSEKDAIWAAQGVTTAMISKGVEVAKQAVKIGIVDPTLLNAVHCGALHDNDIAKYMVSVNSNFSVTPYDLYTLLDNLKSGLTFTGLVTVLPSVKRSERITLIKACITCCKKTPLHQCITCLSQVAEALRIDIPGIDEFKSDLQRLRRIHSVLRM